MEKSIEWISYLEEQFDLKEMDIRTYSPLVLAYIGDAIYDLLIRTIIVRKGNAQPNKLHKRTSCLVKAAAQSELIEQIKDELTPEEEQIYKRGRNAKSPTMAKNASMAEYRRATGLEALVGYLYLKQDSKRIIDLLKIGLEKTGELS